MTHPLTYLSLVWLALPGIAFGWGATGHEVICEIAWAELTSSARNQVVALLRQDPDYDRFAKSCAWADGPPRQRPPDHYMNVPRDTRAITVSACVTAETCLFRAIEVDIAVLRNPASSARERLAGLKLLAHWVGDIHQPMHVSFEDDRGGNSVAALVEINGEPVESNLHAVWDGWIIRQRLGTDYREIARSLRASASPADREHWQGDSPVDWANESFSIVRSPATRYCFRKQGACWYAGDNMLLDRGEARRLLTIDDRYAAAHAPTVERRLLQAGIRLGALLNRVLP